MRLLSSPLLFHPVWDVDEPTGDLDTFNTVEIMDLLLRINQEKRTTCLMVTHNPDIECYADRLLYLEDGRFVEQAINVQQTPLIYEDYAGTTTMNYFFNSAFVQNIFGIVNNKKVLSIPFHAT